MQDQATELRKLVSRAAPMPAVAAAVAAPVMPPITINRPLVTPTRPAAAAHAVHGARVLAITSGKGGVGKSNVSVNLAARLASMGRKVVLLDADLGLANADVLCNVTIRANLAHVIAGRRELSDVIVDATGGFKLIPGASGLSQMANLSDFERARMVAMLRQLETEHDLLMIDTGAGIGPNVMSFLLAADELLVITTPEPTAITDAYAVIKAVSRQRETVPVSLLVNMARDRDEAVRVYEKIAAVSRRFLGVALSDAGHVLLDARVPAAVRKRVPFVLDAPQSPASLCLKQLAHKLDKHAAEPGHGGFFRKVASWLAG
jgi:flagellar biosynthesis protein FlhG